MSEEKKELVLVTGGTGLVGYGIQTYLKEHPEAKHGAEWVFLGDKDYDLRKESETHEMFKKYQPTYVIHLAARVGGLFTNLKYKVEFYRENILIADNVMERCRIDKVKKLIKHQNEKHGWEFIFLGANIDAAETAVSMGISRDRAADYISDHEGTALNYSVLSEVTSAIRSGIGVAPGWSKSITEDIKRRKR